MDKKYAAFLCYSHAADAALSAAVRDALQQLAKPWHRRRALRVFRDDSSLAANEALWPSIQAAMDTSRYFILLASPEAAASPWVAREISYWLDHNPPGTLLIAVTSGELHWDAARQDFDRERTTCIPDVLFGRRTEEPRWVDLRGLPADQLTLRNTAFRDRMAELAAPLHNLAKDDLIGADIRQHRRTQRLVRATIATLATLVVMAGIGAAVAVDRTRAANELRVVAREQEELAEKQRARAEQGLRDALVRQLLAEADLLTRTDVPVDAAEYPAAIRLSLAARELRDDEQVRASLLGYTASSDIRATLVGHTNAVRGIAYSPDGSILVTGGFDHTVRLWDLRSPDRPRPLGEPLTAHTGLILDVQYSPDGRLFATADVDGRVILWDARDPTRPVPLGDPLTAHTGPVSAALFAPTQPLLATAGLDGQVILWDVSEPARPKRIGEPLVHDDEIWTAAFSPDGRRLAIGGRDAELLLWDLENRESVTRLPTADTDDGPIRAVAFHPEGHLIAVGGFRSAVEVWDVTDPSATSPVTSTPMTEWVYTLTFSPAGQLAVGGAMPTLSIFTINLTFRSMNAIAQWPESFDSSIERLRFSPDGETIAVGSGNGYVSLRMVDSPYPRLSTIDATAVALFPDGRTLAVIDVDTFTRWDISDPHQPRQLTEPYRLPTYVDGAAVSPDGRILATRSSSDDPLVRLWDISDPATVTRRGLALAAGPKAALSFSPDGRLLATASEEAGLGLWDITNPDDPRGVRLSADNEPVRSAAFSPDGRFLVMGSGFSRVVMWDVSDPGHPRMAGRPLTHHVAPVDAVAFSPDGSRLATGDEAGLIALWDVTDPTRPTLLGRTPVRLTDPSITMLAFSPDGRVVIAAHSFEVSLWEVSYPPRPVRVGRLPAWGQIAVAADNRTLAVSGGLGHTHLWDYSRVTDLRANLVEHACAVAGRGLTEREWAELLPTIPYRDTCPAATG